MIKIGGIYKSKEDLLMIGKNNFWKEKHYEKFYNNFNKSKWNI